MKTAALLLVTLVVALSGFAQEVSHIFYTTHFNPQKHTPDWVKWTLTPPMLTAPNVGRTNDFKADPSIPGMGDFNKDYDGAGYDKGHMMDAEDAGSQLPAEHESFYFSNMVPQTPSLNRGVWKKLETWCRSECYKHAKTLVIVAGPLGELKTIGAHQIVVPTFCWKAILEDGHWTCYLMPNTADADSKPFAAYVSTLADLDTKLGLKVEDLK
jgi:endonuclease G